MHEISLVAELVDECVRRAGCAGRPVASVRVRYATTIPADGLRQAFEVLTRDTPVAGAALDAEPFDRVLDCPACDFAGALGHDDVVAGLGICPRCATPTPLPPTPELELLALSLR